MPNAKLNWISCIESKEVAIRHWLLHINDHVQGQVPSTYKFSAASYIYHSAELNAGVEKNKFVGKGSI